MFFTRNQLKNYHFSIGNTAKMIYEKIRVINGNTINIDGYNILITISIIINITPIQILPFLNISILSQQFVSSLIFL